MNKYLWSVKLENCDTHFWVLTRNKDAAAAARKAKRLIPLAKREGEKDPGRITKIESEGYIDIF